MPVAKACWAAFLAAANGLPVLMPTPTPRRVSPGYKRRRTAVQHRYGKPLIGAAWGAIVFCRSSRNWPLALSVWCTPWLRKPLWQALEQFAGAPCLVLMISAALMK